MTSPRKIKSYTRLAMMKSTQAQKSLSEIETDTLVSINEQFDSINEAIGQLSDTSNQMIQDISSNSDAIALLEDAIGTMQDALNNLIQRVEALESI